MSRLSYEIKIKRIYNGQIASSIERGHELPDYSLEELSEWILNQPNWDRLWKNYLSSYSKDMKHFNRGYPSYYNPDLSPSVDRIDPTKPYELSNIQLVTWRQNQLNNIEYHKRPVNRYDLKGRYIDTIACVTLAISVYGRNVVAACNKRQNSVSYFQFRYSDEYPSGKNIESCEYPVTVSKEINMYHINGEYLTSFESASEASRITGIPRRNICSCANFQQQTVYGFRFRFSLKFPKFKNIKPLNVSINENILNKVKKVMKCLDM